MRRRGDPSLHSRTTFGIDLDPHDGVARRLGRELHVEAQAVDPQDSPPTLLADEARHRDEINLMLEK